jgi:hypothetical protein
MRSSPPVTYRLTFVLPAGALAVQSGIFSGWVQGCELVIAGPFIAITGPSRERVQEQAARLLRVSCQKLRAVSIEALLETPPPGGGRDGWTIIVNADIAFAPTGLGATFPPASLGAVEKDLVA